MLLVLLPACDTSPRVEPGADGDEAAGAKPAASEYLPLVEDTAIVFTHRFIPAEYAEGKRIVVEGFGEAMEASGQTRRTYFLARPDSAEVVAISFFHATSSSAEWMNSDVRERVLAELRPLYREPLEVAEYHAEHVHDTHEDADDGPGYLPETGDEVVLLAHRFPPENYEPGKTSIVREFARNLEAAGQRQRSYFLDSPGNHEVLVASFVHPEGRADAWLQHEVQEETRAALSQLQRDSLVVRRYVVEAVHNAN